MVTFKITLHLCQWTLCGRNKHLWEHRMQFIRIDTCFKLLIRSNSKVFDRILQVLHLFPSYWAAFLPWMAAAEKLSAVSLQWRLLEGAPGPWVSSAAGVEALQDGAGQDTLGALTKHGLGLLSGISGLGKKNCCCENNKLVWLVPLFAQHKMWGWTHCRAAGPWGCWQWALNYILHFFQKYFVSLRGLTSETWG